MADETTTAPLPFVLRMLRDLDKRGTYIAIKNAKQYQQVIASLKKHGTLALDTETTGLDTITAKCLGYSFSAVPHTAYWVPITVDPQMKLLKKLIAKKHLIFYNASYDLAIVQNHLGQTLTNSFSDCMFACFFRDIDGFGIHGKLKQQAEMLLGWPSVELKDILAANESVATGKPYEKIKIKSDQVDFTKLEEWQQRIYGCQDADVTLRLFLHPEVKDAVQHLMPKIWNLEHKVVPVVMHMYQNGIKVDLKKLAEMDTILQAETEQAQTTMNEIAAAACAPVIVPADFDPKADDANPMLKAVFELNRLMKKTGFNPGSATQKRYLLFNLLGLPVTRRAESGEPSTDKLALDEIELEHQIIPVLKHFMKMNTRRSNYTTSIPEMINPVTGRVHPSLKQTGARTGRFSCSKPNFQAVSRDQDPSDPVHIRSAFVAEKGNVVLAADYSQIELRIAASLSGEPVLCNGYLAGEDVHTATASVIYGIPPEQVTPAQRTAAKTANFSILYGISAYTLCARNRKVLPTVEAAQDLIDRWFAALPVLSRWIRDTKFDARKLGYAETFFGRIRPIPALQRPGDAEIKKCMDKFLTKEWSKRYSLDDLYEIAVNSLISGAERESVSHVVSGTAADIIKIAMVNVDNAILKSGLPIKMCLQVHDELLFEVPTKLVKTASKLIRENMELKEIAPGWVPITVDIGTGKSWFEAK